MDGSSVALFGLLLLLAREGRTTSLSLEVRLYANESDGSFTTIETFSYDRPFTKTSSNVPPRGVEGYVYDLGDASDPQEPPFSPNSTWMALVRGSPDTLSEQLDVVRSYGYSVLLVYATNGSDLEIDNYVSGSQFPVALIGTDAADYINARLALAPPPSSSLKLYLEVGIASDFSIVLTLFSALMLVCIIMCMCWVCRWQRRAMQSEEDVEYYQNLIRQLEVMEQTNEAANAARVKEEARAEFSKLPVAAYDLAAHGEHPHCPVCYADFEEGTPLKVLPCGHFFHPDCVGTWLVEKHLNCPVCRQDIVKQEDATSL